MPTPSQPPLQQPIRLSVPGRLPSWNAILGMGHWQREKFKESIQLAFLSALRATGPASSMKTTTAKSTMSTAAVTLGFYMETVRQKRKLRSAKKRLEAKLKKQHSSK